VCGAKTNGSRVAARGVMAVLAVIGLVLLTACDVGDDIPPEPLQTSMVVADSSMALQRDPGTVPDVLIILTDDQRWDSLWAMDNVRELLQAEGMTFENAFSPTPWCCPARASLLSGGYYAHNTQVHTNGDMGKLRDEFTLATRLQSAGYATAMIGKYFASYSAKAPYVPPGWTYFNGTSSPQKGMDWFDFEVVIGSSTPNSSSEGVRTQVREYVTYYERDRALEFLDAVDADTPLFLYFSTHAAHGPYTPAPGDEDVFSDFIYEGRAYLEEDLSDKPKWVQDNATTSFDVTRPGDELETLLAVDRAVAALIARLEELGRLDKTYILFTSDQGNLWGEHGLAFKGKPYEEIVRSPLVIRGPDVLAGASRPELVSNTLDVAATVLDLVGEQDAGDGQSLLPLLRGEQSDWRDTLLLQSFNEPTWSALRIRRDDGDWKYAEWADGSVELYDLEADPFEEESLHASPQYQSLVEEFSQTLFNLRGVAMKPDAIPSAEVGQPYAFQLAVWGGAGPYTWRAVRNLPDWMELDPATGVLSGTPTGEGCWTPVFAVAGTSVATHAQVPEEHRRSYTICTEAAQVPLPLWFPVMLITGLLGIGGFVGIGRMRLARLSSWPEK
jgi:N-acetylglucosamine-6-sulfatase